MTRDKLLYKICPIHRIFNCCNEYTDEYCDDCKRIMSKWLDKYDKHVIEQYKADTGLKDTIREIHDNVSQEMYCKGIDDFVKKVKEHHYVLSDVINSTDYGMFTVGIEQIAEELKAGDKNVCL